MPIPSSIRLPLLACLLASACAAPELVPGVNPPLPADELGDLTALGSAETDERAQAEADLAGEPPARRVALLRSGLWLREPAAAAACARRLDPAWLDAGETARAADLLLADVRDPAQAQTLLGVLGSREVPEVLGRQPAPELVAGLGPLLRGDHMKALLARCRDLDVHAAAAGRRVLVQDVLPVSDRERDAVAATLLHQELPPASAGPPAGPPAGLPAGLRQILMAWARDDGDPLLSTPEVAAWWLRWLLASTPSGDDVLPLCNAALACLQRDDQRALAVVVRACGFLQDDASAELLRRLDQREAKTPRTRAAVLAALARRNQASGARTLERMALEDGHALLLWLEAAPARAAVVLTQAILATSPRTGAAALKTWGALRAEEPAAGVFAPEAWQTELAARALAIPDLDGLRLMRLGAEFRGCRTRAVAQAGARALLRRPPADADLAAVPPVVLADGAAFLELGAAEEFRFVLRSFANAAAAGPRRTWARVCLLRLMDAPSAAAMPGWLDADLLKECPDARNALALVRAPALDAFLRPPRGDGGPGLIAWALRCGLPPALAGQLLDETPVRDHVLDAFHAGTPVEGLARFLAFSPDAVLNGVGEVRDPRVTAWLMRFIDQRELGRCRWASRELAWQGDRAALADLSQGLRDGRPGWFRPGLPDVSSRSIWSFCLEELESNRERAALVQRSLGAALGGGTAAPTPLTTPRARWSRLSGEFTWSPLVLRYVPRLIVEK